MINQVGEGASSSDLTCSCCGKPVELDEFDIRYPLVQRMKQERVCFICSFWKDKIENPPANREIINGEHYVFHEWVLKKEHFLGFGGKPMYILKEDKTVKKSNNVWHQGEIPLHFREQLPDTAKFITEQAYNQINKNINFQCRAKGCWDRYNCFWYHIEIETDKGPWNTVPDGHVPGEEHCDSFIDKNKIYE